MSGDIQGIRCVDPSTWAAWKRTLSWWAGGRLVATKTGEGVWRRLVPAEAWLMKASRGRVRISVTAPIVVLTSTGARSGQSRDTPLAYFTDAGDVILIASNYGGAKHPAWYHNLRAHPVCELHIGTRGGRFIARETEGADRERLYGLATRMARNFDHHAARTQGNRQIPVLRLTPA